MPPKRFRGKFAAWLFDQITGASYYGMHFREVLATDPVARGAAETLVRRLQYHRVRGMEETK